MSTEPHSTSVYLELVYGPIHGGQLASGLGRLSELPPPDE